MWILLQISHFFSVIQTLWAWFNIIYELSLSVFWVRTTAQWLRDVCERSILVSNVLRSMLAVLIFTSSSFSIFVCRHFYLQDHKPSFQASSSVDWIVLESVYSLKAIQYFNHLVQISFIDLVRRFLLDHRFGTKGDADTSLVNHRQVIGTITHGNSLL